MTARIPTRWLATVRGLHHVTAVSFAMSVFGAGAPVDGFNAALGTQTIGVKYGFTDRTRLVETAEAILSMGSNILKISLEPDYPDNYALPKCKGVGSFAELVAKEPSFKVVLDMPFKFYFLWAHSFKQVKWADGLSETEREVAHREMFDLTAYLLATYSGTGKNFFIGSWENDWLLYQNYDLKFEIPAARLQGMVDWMNVRQQAVDEAKAQTPHTNVKVWHYLEVNQAVLGMRGKVSVASHVLPKTHVDFVSYSSYDALGNMETLKSALDYIDRMMPAKEGMPGRRVFIGEYGFPLAKVKTPAEQDRRAREVCRTALQWGCPFVLYWELYCNEIQDGKHRGFWLIDDKETKQPFYFTLQRYYAGMREFRAQFRERCGREPARDEWLPQALDLLKD